jgi:ATP-dependent DNA helicase RecG
MVTFARHGGVSGTEETLIAYLSENPGKKARDVAEALGISQRIAERWLKALRDTGQVEFVGSPKSGGYYVKAGENK